MCVWKKDINLSQINEVSLYYTRNYLFFLRNYIIFGLKS